MKIGEKKCIFIFKQYIELLPVKVKTITRTVSPEMLSEKYIKNKIAHNDYYYSKHADQERQNDQLSLLDVEESILSGRILEHYSDTGRGKSCLMVGFTKEGKPIHCVCGQRGEYIVIVTVYIPKPPSFKTPFERG